MNPEPTAMPPEVPVLRVLTDIDFRQALIEWALEDPAELRALIKVDEAKNVLFGHLLPGPTLENMTISERWGRMAREGDGRSKIACMLLDFVDEGHCERAIKESNDERWAAARRDQGR